MKQLPNFSKTDGYGILILLGILLTGGVILYFYKKKTAEKSNTNSNSPKSSNPVSSSSKPGTNEKPSSNYPPIEQLQTVDAERIKSNPHWKGVWMSGGNNYITEPYSGKTYKKDKPVEIFEIVKKYNLYYVKYYGDMCYFPINQIAEEGPWN